MNPDYEEHFVPLQYEAPKGRTLEEWKANVRETDLFRRGDCTLIWVSEGDLAPDGLWTKAYRRKGEPMRADQFDDEFLGTAHPEPTGDKPLSRRSILIARAIGLFVVGPLIAWYFGLFNRLAAIWSNIG